MAVKHGQLRKKTLVDSNAQKWRLLDGFVTSVCQSKDPLLKYEIGYGSKTFLWSCSKCVSGGLATYKGWILATGLISAEAWWLRVLQEREDCGKHGIKLCRVIYNTFISRKNSHKTAMDGEMLSRRDRPTNASMERTLNDDDNDDDDDMKETNNICSYLMLYSSQCQWISRVSHLSLEPSRLLLRVSR